MGTFNSVVVINKMGCIGVLMLLVAPISHAVDMEAGGSVRLRAESKQDFNLDDSSQTYWLSQVRVNVKAKFNSSNSLFVELQDARVYAEDIGGIPGVNDDVRNQPFADPLDIHQFHWTYTSGNTSLKVGRQKLNLGDQRLVASLEWVNTARVHDGVRFTYQTKERTYDVFASALVSIDPNELNDQSTSGNRYFDSQFHGVFVTDRATINQQKLEYWWLYRGNNSGVFDDTIHTLGARLAGQKEQWGWDIQGAWQTGDFYDPGRAITLDHRAAMLHLSASYQLSEGTLGVGYNWASGDDNPNDNDHGTFDNLYPLNHAYYGYMDLFSLQNIHNLEFTYVRPKLFGNKTKLRIAWQHFWLDDTNDAWYNAGLRANSARLNNAITNGADSNVGNEVDITLSAPLLGVNVVAGYSHFFAGKYTDDTGNGSNAHFLFLQLGKAF